MNHNYSKELISDWRKPVIEQLHNLYFSNILLGSLNQRGLRLVSQQNECQKKGKQINFDLRI
jgi:hypothetical protein